MLYFLFYFAPKNGCEFKSMRRNGRMVALKQAAAISKYLRTVQHDPNSLNLRPTKDLNELNEPKCQ
jgi:hypothetical protein